MNITYDIETKEVKGLPWDTEVEFTYFLATMKIDGKEVAQSTLWCKDPNDAIESAINHYAMQLKSKAPSGFERFGDRLKVARGKSARWENYRGYWKLTTEETAA